MVPRIHAIEWPAKNLTMQCRAGFDDRRKCSFLSKGARHRGFCGLNDLGTFDTRFGLDTPRQVDFGENRLF